MDRICYVFISLSRIPLLAEHVERPDEANVTCHSIKLNLHQGVHEDAQELGFIWEETFQFLHGQITAISWCFCGITSQS